jgi:YD repeat-containing protein
MLQGKRTRRIIAATLLTVMLTNTLAPTVTYALTSGPTAPEATSFEPVDTTDMVNMQTGNLTYNIPLIEVPGPEGGYPLSLSYHPGIQTNEDASWVGLGWSLNPGAINRNVNGYPDDWKYASGTSHVYWSGGSTTTYRAGVSIGLANTPFSVNAGLSFSNDTYQGFGTGMDMRFGLSGPLGSSPLSGGLSFGVSADGQSSLSGGIGVSYLSAAGLNGSLSANASTNFESLQAGFSGGIGIGSASLVGASITTNGDKPSLDVGGFTAPVKSSSSARVQTQSSGWNIDIPTPVPGLSLSMGYNKTRYWTDESTGVQARGSLYNEYSSSYNVAFDSYSLLANPTEKNFIDNPDPTILQGGAYPAFDNYEVNAQGLAGNMRPYQFKGHVYTQKIMFTGSCNGCPEYNLLTVSPGTADVAPRFRFVGDFSNTYKQNYNTYSSSDMSTTLEGASLPFGVGVTGETGTDGFQNNQLAGSKHVDVGIKIKPTQLLGYNATERLQDGMIEGFTITNASGVTYTFGLPAYSYGEELYQEKKGGPGVALNRQTKTAPYAYTWYLTSITGPDYVDKNGDGYANDGDWGYWVNFEYGKWASDYIWRNPSEGYNTDEDNEWQNCSMGYKEVYYLNAIRTRSHVALFEKEVRPDGKGAANEIFSKSSGDPKYTTPGVFNNNSASSLRLSHIYLLNASDGNYVTPSLGSLNANVLDATDIDAAGRLNVEAKAIRVIDFTHDYSLCKNTSNSFYTEGQLLGKLSLTALTTRGKGGANIFPPVRFEYDLQSNPVDVTLTGANGSTPASFTTTNGDFKEGDLITSTSLNAFCGVIIKKSSSSPYTYTLANCSYTGGTITAAVRTTKNPPYNKDAYDAWGMYKSDINTQLLLANLNQGRTTSTVSAPGVDAWSLRTITTELGSKININYESDNYFTPPTEYNKQSIVINQIELNQATGTIVLHVDKAGNSSIQMANSYSIGQNISAVLLMGFQPPDQTDGSNGFGGLVVDTRTSTIEFSDFIDNDVKWKNLGNYPKVQLNGGLTVQSIDDINNTITVQCSDEFLLGNQTRSVIFYRGDGSSNSPIPNTVKRGQVYGGNLFLNGQTAIQGGGIRVRSLSVTEELSGVVSSSTFEYDKNGISSGISAYTPSLAQPCYDFPSQFEYHFYVGPNRPISEAEVKVLCYKFYRRALLANSSIVFSLAREMPAPGVMYGNVTVSKQIKNPNEDVRKIDGDSKTEYEFEVFKPIMVDRVEVASSQSSDITYPRTLKQYARYLSIVRLTGCIGNVKRIIQYDNTGKKLSETENHYLHDNVIKNYSNARDFFNDYKQLLQNKFRSQGYIHERYAEVKYVEHQSNDADNGVKGTISGKEDFPCIQTGQTVKNYVNGTEAKSDILAYDFYSGALIKSVETDAYGNRFMTEIQPAYQVSNYNSALGLKLFGGRNMLTQTAASYLWKLDVNNNSNDDRLVSASASTWGNSTNVIDPDGNTLVQNINVNTSGGDVWRMQSSYSYQPDTKTSDGLTDRTDFHDFNWGSPASSVADGWSKTLEMSLYDVNSKALEAIDENGLYAATHMGYNNTKVVLTGSPAKYYEIAYSGAEDEAVNSPNNVFIKKADGIVSTGPGVAHTGTKSLKIGVSGQKGFVYTVSTDKLVAGRSYLASVWVKPVSGSASDVKLYYDINGTVKTPSISSGISKKTSGDWKLINLLISGSDIMPGNTLTVGCRNDHATAEAYIDDIRIRPFNASTTAYVYDAFSGELTHVLDNNNWYTRFEYDAAGRLTKTYIEKNGIGEFKTKDYEYNFGKLTTYQSDPINQTYTRNNCTVGQGGTDVPVNLPLGTIVSVVSPDDANARAQRYAQELANRQGNCATATLRLTNNSNSGETFAARINGVYYFFPGNGLSKDYAIPPGTSTIEIWPRQGNPGPYSFVCVYSGAENKTGYSAVFPTRDLSVNTTLQLLMYNP